MSALCLSCVHAQWPCVSCVCQQEITLEIGRVASVSGRAAGSKILDSKIAKYLLCVNAVRPAREFGRNNTHATGLFTRNWGNLDIIRRHSQYRATRIQRKCAIDLMAMPLFSNKANLICTLRSGHDVQPKSLCRHYNVTRDTNVCACSEMRDVVMLSIALSCQRASEYWIGDQSEAIVLRFVSLIK